MAKKKITSLSLEQVREQIEIFKQLKPHIEQVETLSKRLYDISTGGFEWRDVDIRLWKVICEKYDEANLLNCFGDIYVTEDKTTYDLNEAVYIGRRLGWNLQLSEEKYQITEIIERDDEGDIYDIDYTFEIIEEKE